MDTPEISPDNTPPSQTQAVTPSGDTSLNNTNDNTLNNFAKSESQPLGFTGKVKDMFSGKKAVSTTMALGYVFTWSERVLTYFRTGFSWYRDIPKMVTGKNLGEQSRTEILKTSGRNIKNLFVPGSDNNFFSQYTTGEKLEALGMGVGFSQQLWFLLSSREGDIPEGKTVLEKAKNVFKNPKHHVAQLTSMWMGVVVELIAAGRILSGIENLSHNAQGNRIGFNPRKAIEGQDRIAKAEKLMPLISGITIALYAPLTLYGLLKIPKPKHPEKETEENATLAEESSGEIVVSGHPVQDKNIGSFAKSQSQIQSSGKETGLKEIIAMLSPSNLKDMLSFATHKDPIGFIGRLLGFGLDIGSFAVGFARLKQIESGQYTHKFGGTGSPEWNKARANAVQTRNVGILGFALTALYNMYVYDTTMHAYRKEKEALRAGAHEQLAR